VQAAQMYRHYLQRPDVEPSASVHLCIARCEYEQQKYDECIKALKRAIRLSPNDLRLWCVLAMSLLQPGRRCRDFNIVAFVAPVGIAVAMTWWMRICCCYLCWRQVQPGIYSDRQRVPSDRHGAERAYRRTGWSGIVTPDVTRVWHCDSASAVDV
jgi:tetratricopeptide (TPR) repeat protein